MWCDPGKEDVFLLAHIKLNAKIIHSYRKPAGCYKSPKKGSARRGKQLTQISNQCTVTLIASEVS